MRKILLLIAVMLFITSSVIAQNKATYTSTTNGYWHAAATWGGSGVPSTSDTAIIDGETVIIQNDAGSGSDVTIATLTITSGALTLRNDLTVSNAGGSSATSAGATVTLETGDFTISDGNFTNAGDISVGAGRKIIFSSGTGDTFTNTGSVDLSSTSESFSSIIFNGTYSGGVNAMTYSRFVEGLDGQWDLVGAPLNGMNISTFITSNEDLADEDGTDDFGIGPYNNDGTGWDTYQTSDVDFTTFSVGTGYQMATESGSNVEFKGNLTTATVNVTITSNETDPYVATGANGFFLLSNPYPSYIIANNNGGTNQVLSTANLLELQSNNVSGEGPGTHQAIWAWDGAGSSGSGSWSTITNASSIKYMAPGQAFMVRADGHSGQTGTFSFTTAMQSSSGSGDDFYAGDAMDPDDRAELFIGLNQGEGEKHTEIYFINEGSDGVDSSYDGALMESSLADNTFSIYSRILDSDDGTDIAVNALAYSEMWDKVIPIGINAIAGEEMIVSVTHKTTPADLKIYLEDAQEGTFTLINNENFVLTPSSDLEGIGRFFIHTTENALSNEEVNTSLLNAYKEVNANYITIEGLATQTTSTQVSLYNILGTKVMDTTLDNTTNTQTISTNGFSTGIYIIKLESGANQLTKKLIIK